MTLTHPLTRSPFVSAAANRSRFATVLLATDLSSASDRATVEATKLAEALGARLIVVNVIDMQSGIGRQLLPGSRNPRVDQVRADRESPLMAIVDDARSRGVEATFLLWTGEPGQGIVAAAEAEHADLVVVGTRALGVTGRFILGSVSNYVVNHSHCPVVIAR
jgi:nucleotide-binding universal stress UspA family protein